MSKIKTTKQYAEDLAYKIYDKYWENMYVLAPVLERALKAAEKRGAKIATCKHPPSRRKPITADGVAQLCTACGTLGVT